MVKSTRKNKKPPTLDIDFGAPLGAFAVDPSEVATTSRSTLVPLGEDDSGHRFIIYTAKDGPRAELRYEGGIFWASQGQMAEMFGVTPQNVTMHLRNIFKEGELVEASVCKESLHRAIRDLPGTADIMMEGNANLACL